MNATEELSLGDQYDNAENGSHTVLGVVQVSDNMRNIDINKFCRFPY